MGATTKEVAEERRAEIVAMWRSGKYSQSAIGRKLGIPRQSVKYHLRCAGIDTDDDRNYRKALPIKVKDGVEVRRCAECREVKPLFGFPSRKHAVCNVCYAAKRDRGAG